MTTSVFRTEFARWLFAAGTVALQAIAATAADVPEWQDPQALHSGVEAPSATKVVFGDRASALTLDAANSPYVRSLNGTWKFHWAATP
ncbi:MAG TPA: hypothetical protein VEQ65_04660, partial [Opitutus sp.]|nr:hypothetical protein [Opitutus sp.]